jgi:glyoxylase-like metal-dependent hydrolase (beta-lactamase superfamily II)
LRYLKDKDIEKLDWILLTHIHQDHAGGLGHLIQHFPEAKVVTHEKGAQHLVSPDKLWERSKAVLGDIADFYGEILPVPQDNIVVLEEIPFAGGIRILATPGHASHHQCYVIKDWFFAGELFGAFIPMDSRLYIRPATPHRFVLEDYLSSMELVENQLKDTICFAHYSSTQDTKNVLMAAREQLLLWVEITKENKDGKTNDEIVDVLLENDPIFEGYHELDKQMQARERNFSINSIDGIKKYLENGQI